MARGSTELIKGAARLLASLPRSSQEGAACSDETLVQDKDEEPEALAGVRGALRGGERSPLFNAGTALVREPERRQWSGVAPSNGLNTPRILSRHLILISCGDGQKLTRSQLRFAGSS